MSRQTFGIVLKALRVVSVCASNTAASARIGGQRTTGMETQARRQRDSEGDSSRGFHATPQLEKRRGEEGEGEGEKKHLTISQDLF